MSEKVEYPKFLFKFGAPDVVAQTFESHQTYAADGYLTADEFDALPVAVPPAEASVEDVAPADDPFEAMSAASAVLLVGETSDPALLRAWRATEENRPNGGRKTVLRALADKLGETVVAAISAEPVIADQIGAAGE